MVSKLLDSVTATLGTPEQRLRQDLSASYHRDVRPVINPDDIINITFDYKLKRIVDLVSLWYTQILNRLSFFQYRKGKEHGAGKEAQGPSPSSKIFSSGQDKPYMTSVVRFTREMRSQLGMPQQHVAATNSCASHTNIAI